MNPKGRLAVFQALVDQGELSWSVLLSRVQTKDTTADLTHFRGGAL